MSSFIEAWKTAFSLYSLHGARSSKKVDSFHNFIKSEIQKCIDEVEVSHIFSVCLEKDVKSYNSSGKKKCDIVVCVKGEPYIVFPVKIPMTNYKQNKNNNWENLTGECCHLRWANPDLKIVPINIFIDKTPYLKSDGAIGKFENVTYSDIEVYNNLKERGIVNECYNFIFDVEQADGIGEKYKNMPNIVGYNEKTPYKSFRKMIAQLFSECHLIQNSTA